MSGVTRCAPSCPSRAMAAMLQRLLTHAQASRGEARPAVSAHLRPGSCPRSWPPVAHCNTKTSLLPSVLVHAPCVERGTPAATLHSHSSYSVCDCVPRRHRSVQGLRGQLPGHHQVRGRPRTPSGTVGRSPAAAAAAAAAAAGGPLRQATAYPDCPGSSRWPLRQATACPDSPGSSRWPLRQATACPDSPGSSRWPLRHATACPDSPGSCGTAWPRHKQLMVEGECQHSLLLQARRPHKRPVRTQHAPPPPRCCYHPSECLGTTPCAVIDKTTGGRPSS
jgi:hypothetical protein